ncbi:4Fe-4S dicluster domain-containing protein [Actinoallomurus oryzae]|uniref:4Fe-4S dicluster domain-containing protein n=1 Tax=Actinoallomurus oryzae TaxID=502180 RepID=A0ABP8QNT2_9ACTN
MSWILDGLADLHGALRADGYTVIGPTHRDGAIVLAELASADDLPYGWGVTLEPGGYRTRRRDDDAAFAHSAGPQSWKPFLHPPRVKLWEGRRTEDGGFSIQEAEDTPPRYAFLGVRPCDLRAIGVLDHVMTGGAHPDEAYGARRTGAFIIAVNCTEPGETCFCASMGTGPRADAGYDLALTEVIGEGRFLVEVGTSAGTAMLERIPHEEADETTTERALAEVAAAADRMGRQMPEPEGLRDLLAGSLDAARWDDVASRCLTCGNCTMVCPTCFCTTVEDVTDLTGEHAERWQRWDSCFDLDFSHLPGGSVRTSGKSRYRQWLTHKLGTWHDQFGSSGCVGCGRCIVWCPVGIDLTEEVAALREEREEQRGKSE